VVLHVTHALLLRNADFWLNWNVCRLVKSILHATLMSLEKQLHTYLSATDKLGMGILFLMFIMPEMR